MNGGHSKIQRRRSDSSTTDGEVTGFSVVETKKYVYLGGSVIRELNANNNVLKEYVRGLDLGGGIGSIIYQKKASDYYYYHYNHKGDVVALTDANGKLAAYYEYDAWGNTITEAEQTAVDNPYRYSTKEWDEKAGLYYFGARYYYPEIGRWTQRHPAGTADGLNLYGYARNAPVGLVDAVGYRAESAQSFRERCCEQAKRYCAGVIGLAFIRFAHLARQHGISRAVRMREVHYWLAAIAVPCGGAAFLCLPYPEHRAEIEDMMRRAEQEGKKLLASLSRSSGPRPSEDIPLGPYIEEPDPVKTLLRTIDRFLKPNPWERLR